MANFCGVHVTDSLRLLDSAMTLVSHSTIDATLETETYDTTGTVVSASAIDLKREVA